MDLRRFASASYVARVLLKPRLKPIPDFFRNRLPLFLGKFGAIRPNLIRSGASALVHEIVPRRCAACNPSMLAAGLTPRMSFVAT